MALGHGNRGTANNLLGVCMPRVANLRPMKIARTLGFGLLVAASSSALPSCKDKHEFVQAPILGLPCAAKGQQLVVPLLISAQHDDGKLLQIYIGGNVRPETMSIEKGKKQTMKVRLAACPQINSTIDTRACAERADWIGGEQSVEVDGTAAAPTVVLAVAGEHPCNVAK